ncbi:MAG: hypothetical protein OHK0032_11370 [Thermodesulfovibrionales bacterium]
MKWLKRYKESIIWAILIIGALFLSTSKYVFGELPPVVAAVGGLLFSIPIKHFWRAYMKPVIEFGEKENELIREGGGPEYVCNRIIIKNTGRSAAKNCKGYIEVGNKKERVCWTQSKERPNATINANDEERLDFCAFFYRFNFSNVSPDYLPKVIAPPTVDGWQVPQACRKLEPASGYTIHITAENAEPVSKKVPADDKIENNNTTH